jgi:predicted MFS family arabinose efflux permease
MTCLFAVQAALLYADQNLLAPNLSAAAADFGLDDAEKDRVLGGALMACFFLVGAPAALVVGYLADRVRRVRLLFAVVAVGAVPCLAVYWARTVPAFFFLRALTGVSVGGCFPLVFSLLGDLFPARRRAATSALVQIATGAGLAAGQALAGTVGQPGALGWRAPFAIAAVPALALNFFMVLVCPEPPRGAFEKMALRQQQLERLEERRGRRLLGGVGGENGAASVAEAEAEAGVAVVEAPPPPPPTTTTPPPLPKPTTRARTATTRTSPPPDPSPSSSRPHPHHRRHCTPPFRLHLHRLRPALSSAYLSAKQVLAVPSNALVVLQGLPGCLPWGVMLTYMNDFLARQKGLSVREATMVLLVFGLSGGLGVIAGGAGGQWLYNRRKEALAVFSGLAVLLGIAPTLWLINADLLAAGVPAVAAAAAAAGAVASVPGPCMRAVMLNVNPPGVRGAALALQSLTDDLGKGVGPVVVAALIGSLGGSRARAFNVAVAGWVPCGLLILGLAWTMRRDEKRAQEALAAAVRARRRARERRRRRGGAGAGAAGAVAVGRGDLEDGRSRQELDEDELDELELELELDLGTEDDEEDLREEEEEEEEARAAAAAASAAPAELALTTSPRALEAEAEAEAAAVAAAGSCCSRSSVDSDRALLLAHADGSGGGGGAGGGGGGSGGGGKGGGRR